MDSISLLILMTAVAVHLLATVTRLRRELDSARYRCRELSNSNNLLELKNRRAQREIRCLETMIIPRTQRGQNEPA